MTSNLCTCPFNRLYLENNKTTCGAQISPITHLTVLEITAYPLGESICAATYKLKFKMLLNRISKFMEGLWIEAIREDSFG